MEPINSAPFLHGVEKYILLCLIFGDVAQLVEQRTENPCVGGSIPSITTSTTSLLYGGFCFSVTASLF